VRYLEADALPPALLPVTALLNGGVGPVSSGGRWQEWRGRTLSLPVTVQVRGDHGFPAQSGWHLVVETSSFPAKVAVFPDVELGPRDTYPHQNPVGDAVQNKPWRNGHPCIAEPSAVWGERLGGTDEPPDLTDRLVWAIERFGKWCEAASDGRLHLPGDHFEMPPLPGAGGAMLIGYSESDSDLGGWISAGDLSGGAALVEVSKQKRVVAVQSWSGQDGSSLHAPQWGNRISEASTMDVACRWLRLSSLPITGAWQLPRTYSELRVCLQNDGHDLGDVLTTLGRQARRTEVRGRAVLMLGFPIPERFGDADTRMHWLAISDIPLTKKNGNIDGFRNTESNRKRQDSGLAYSGRRLTWIKCENWAPDQMRTRLCERPAVGDLKVLMIGAGSLGSQVAETLARSGITQIDVQDRDILSAGNLCRHSLDLTDIGRYKAEALVDRLNRVQPDMRSKAASSAFPERLPADPPYDEYDAILDCSGENSVLRAMGRIDWRREKLFISLSMTWAAEGLLTWVSSGTALAAAEVIDRFSTLIGSLGQSARRAEVMEGIGCWHPVFPANPADVQLWSGIGARVVLSALASRSDACGMHYLGDGGGVDYRAG
jgi:hypothetical protein